MIFRFKLLEKGKFENPSSASLPRTLAMGSLQLLEQKYISVELILTFPD